MYAQIQAFTNLTVIPRNTLPLPLPPARLRSRTLFISPKYRPPLLCRPSTSLFPFRVSNSINTVTDKNNDDGGSISSSLSGRSPSIAEEEQKGNTKRVRAYPFHEIEPKWQRYWEQNKTFRTPDDDIDTSKPKYYVLDMFPYPRFYLLCLFWNLLLIVFFVCRKKAASFLEFYTLKMKAKLC